jgi:hypothetical protein
MKNGALQSVTGWNWQYARAGNGHEDVFWTGPGAGNGLLDTLMTVPAVRGPIADSARAKLTNARVPMPAREWVR